MTMQTVIAAGASCPAGPAKKTVPHIPAKGSLRPELAAYFVLPEKPAFAGKEAATRGVLADLSFDRGCD